MGRKLDPTRKEKRGPGRKARKQKGAEIELAKFLPLGKPSCFDIPVHPSEVERERIVWPFSITRVLICLLFFFLANDNIKKKLSSHGRKR